MALDLSREDIDPRPVRSSSGCSKGCLIAVIVVVVLVVGGALYVYLNFKSLATKAVAAVLKSAVEQWDLPAAEKQQIIVRIDRLRDDYIDGRITDDQMRRIVEKITESPAVPAGMVFFLQQKYVTDSPMSDEEKVAARLTLQRVARGVYEKSISNSELDAVMQPAMTTNSKGDSELKEKLTPEELSEFLKLAEAAADKAQVPREPFSIDIVGEIDKAIDGGMKGDDGAGK